MMRKKITIIISVSPFEPEDVVIASALHLKNLDFNNFDWRIIYAIDLRDSNDRRHEKLKELGVDVFIRNVRRGKKAGAINDCLNYLKKSNFLPDYVAFFDVDSRPSENFLVECVSALEKDENAFIASAERRILNPENLVSETIDIECRIFNYLLKRSKFKNFNGLIGVLRGNIILTEKMDEDSYAEDLEFSVRMHSLNYRSIFVDNTHVYEQAPISWKDLYIQRKRWYFGGLQILKKDYLKENRSFAIQIIMTVIFAHFPILLFPLLIMAPPLIIYKFRKIKKLRLVLGMAVYLLVNQIAAITSLYSFIRRREIEWTGIRRVKQ